MCYLTTLRLRPMNSLFLSSCQPDFGEEPLGFEIFSGWRKTVTVVVLWRALRQNISRSCWEFWSVSNGARQGGLPRRRRTSLQRRIVAPLIVESEARPLGGVVVESLGASPVIQEG